MKQRYFLIFGIIAIIGAIFISSCVREEAKEKPKIIDIISNPRLYEGKTVVVEGKFGGWSGGPVGCNKNLVGATRSDTLIYDDTSCLYMTGEFEVLYKEKELNPWDKTNVGGRLKIRAIVSLIDGKPILGK